MTIIAWVLLVISVAGLIVSLQPESRRTRKLLATFRRREPMKLSDFPNTIHVALDAPRAPGDDHIDLLAFRSEAEAVKGDGPTVVAEYSLVKVRAFRKQTVEAVDRIV